MPVARHRLAFRGVPINKPVQRPAENHRLVKQRRPPADPEVQPGKYRRDVTAAGIGPRYLFRGPAARYCCPQPLVMVQRPAAPVKVKIHLARVAG
jgi:hypothetical protein